VHQNAFGERWVAAADPQQGSFAVPGESTEAGTVANQQDGGFEFVHDATRSKQHTISGRPLTTMLAAG
jgi:hypothetical protein